MSEEGRSPHLFTIRVRSVDRVETTLRLCDDVPYYFASFGQHLRSSMRRDPCLKSLHTLGWEYNLRVKGTTTLASDVENSHIGSSGYLILHATRPKTLKMKPKRDGSRDGKVGRATRNDSIAPERAEDKWNAGRRHIDLVMRLLDSYAVEHKEVNLTIGCEQSQSIIN